MWEGGRKTLRFFGLRDKAYDSDKLRKNLKANRIDLIGSHRRIRKKKRFQDGSKHRCYQKRWKLNRTFSWLQNFRRLVVRYERLIEIYNGFDFERVQVSSHY